MNIAVIDADLIGRNRHRFPNLACMKISGFHKARGDAVTLKTNYDGLTTFDKVYLAKVFTDTPIPTGGLFGSIFDLPNLTFGGTGFFYDNAPPLPHNIEHSMPDYHLYDLWAGSGTEFKAYHDYSIGFLTRGCFRHCPFCVNRRANAVVKHSPLSEFLDPSRKKICLLDDNFFGYADWRAELVALIDTGKPFHFKQGLDARLLDDAKAELLFSSRYDGDFIFAFDDWQDRDVIESKLQLIRRYERRRQRVKFYCLCGYDRGGRYDEKFWLADLWKLVKRMALLKRYDCLPYVMRFDRYKQSPYRELYVDLAAFANQPRFFQKMPLTVFARHHRNGRLSSPILFDFQRYLEDYS